MKKSKIILLDLTYFLIITIILILTKIKIGEIIINLQSYGNILSTFTNQNAQEIPNILSQLNAIAIKAFIFLFIIIPLIIFISYIIFQGITFKREKFSYKKFILINLIPFILLILTLFTLNIYLFILFITTSYITFILYFYDFKKINLVYKKIYKLFPIYLVYLILPILIIGFLYLAYTRIPISLDFIWILIFAIIFSILFSVYKIYLIEKLS